MEKEKQLLVLCRGLIERSLNWGDSKAWTNDDFDQLSEEIFDKTKVQLSVSTLKRIWGKVRYENFPTAATLNALSRYLGYASWREFRQKNGPVITDTGIEIEKIIPAKEPEHAAAVRARVHSQYLKNIRLPAARSTVAFFLLATALVLTGFIFIFSKKRPKPADLAKVKFEAIKASDNLPNSVIFNYDASPFNSDSVYIQQSWDPERRERVSGNGKQFTSIYYNPGFFIAKLVVDGQIRKQCPIFIKTQGWKGIIEKNPVPVYLSQNDIKLHNGFMGITENMLRQKTGSPVFNGTWVNFCNVREFKGVDAGNFTFETTVRNSSATEASVCRQMRILLLGTGKAIIIPLTDKGCVSDIDLLTGDTWISGKDHDMRAFGCDFSQFQHLQCQVANHRFKILLNDKPIINIAQSGTIGQIVGIRYECEGAAEIKDVKLSTPGGGSYQDIF